MFEHINTGFIILSSMGVFTLSMVMLLVYGKSLKEKMPTSKVHYFLFLLLAVVVAIPFWDSFETTERIKENTKYFNTSVALECYGGFTPYVVKKESGWVISGERIIKDDLIVNVARCKRVKE